MMRILVTGTRAKIGKTTFIMRLVENLPEFAVIQIKENRFFTSIVSEPRDEEAKALMDHGARQVIHIHAAPDEVQEALNHALCLLSSQVQGIIIEKGAYKPDLQTDIHISLVDREMNPSDPILESSKMITVVLVQPDSKTSGEDPKKWEDTPDVPIFALDLNDTNTDAWKGFWDCLIQMMH